MRIGNASLARSVCNRIKPMPREDDQTLLGTIAIGCDSIENARLYEPYRANCANASDWKSSPCRPKRWKHWRLAAALRTISTIDHVINGYSSLS
jgi:hypothetical protein